MATYEVSIYHWMRVSVVVEAETEDEAEREAINVYAETEDYEVIDGDTYIEDVSEATEQA